MLPFSKLWSRVQAFLACGSEYYSTIALANQTEESIWPNIGTTALPAPTY